jgi:curli biogenesis system outer membrane secretion channel CsgG
MHRKLTLILFLVLGLVWISQSTLSTQNADNLKRMKKRVAVFEFEDKTDHRVRWWTGQSVGHGMADMLVTSLVKSGKYRVIERQEIDRIINEQQLGQSGMVTAQSAAEVGQLLGVEIAIIGSVTEFGSERSDTGGRIKRIGVGVSKNAATVGLDIRFINTSTGEILTAENIRRQKAKKGLSVSTPKFAFKNKNRFDDSLVGKATREAIEDIMKLLDDKSAAIPWQAKIITVKDNTVFINAGSEVGVQVGDVFYIYVEGEELIDPDTGISLGSLESKIGKIEVINNSLGNGKASQCVIKEGSGFKKGDLVRIK